MAKGVEVSLASGTSIQIVPRDPSQLSLVSIDDISILVQRVDEDWRVDLNDSGTISSSLNGVQVNEIDVEIDDRAPEDSAEKSLLRYCIICGGRRYCVTNACANTPCGWICDR